MAAFLRGISSQWICRGEYHTCNSCTLNRHQRLQELSWRSNGCILRALLWLFNIKVQRFCTLIEACPSFTIEKDYSARGVCCRLEGIVYSGTVDSTSLALYRPVERAEADPSTIIYQTYLMPKYVVDEGRFPRHLPP